MSGCNDFAVALRAAIQRNRLGLDELSRRLRERGAPVSASTLSYWQNGDNQPERASSLAAVAVLEELLGEPGLTGLIGPRRPRGGWVPRAGTPLAFDKVWRRPEEIARALAKIGATPEDHLHPLKLSQHLTFRIDANGHEESVRVRRLIQSDRDGTTRMIFVTRYTTLPRPPVVTFAEGCRLARWRADVPSSTCAFEFTLDRPLAAGELSAVEFALRYPPGQTGTHAQLAIARPTRDLILQVTFDPARLPARCYSYWQPRNTLPPQPQREASLDAGAPSFQFVTLDPSPGQYGIAWQWG